MDLSGAVGDFAVHRWTPERPRIVVLLAQTHGRTTGRDGYLASRLVAAGAAVLAPDNLRGRTGGSDPVDAVDDLGLVVGYGHGKHPGLPLVVLGESGGARVAAQFAQRHPEEISGLVLASPVLEEPLELAEGSLEGLPTLWLHAADDDVASHAAAARVLGEVGGDGIIERSFAGSTHELFRGPESEAVLGELLGFLGALVSPPDERELAHASAA